MLTFNKKGVSIIIGYVLLITIGIALSTLVYSWLRFYVTPGEEVSCPEGVSLIIKNYNYDCTANKLNLTLQNKGLFTVDGFVLRANDKQGSHLGVYTLNGTGEKMKPGDVSSSQEYDSDKYFVGSAEKEIKNKLTFIEVQPFVYDKGLRVVCKKIATQVLTCP